MSAGDRYVVSRLAHEIKFIFRARTWVEIFEENEKSVRWIFFPTVVLYCSKWPYGNDLLFVCGNELLQKELYLRYRNCVKDIGNMCGAERPELRQRNEKEGKLKVNCVVG